VFQYLGSARSETARERLVQALDAYLERVSTELHRRRAEILARSLTG